MLQVLFHLPFTAGWFPPNGVPVYGFGAMLFVCFVLTAMVWGPRRCARVGMPKDKLQDLAIVLFLTGIAGARVVYMIQYRDQFPDRSVPGLIAAFFQIWNGGIVFYGSLFGGVLGYVAFYRLVLRKLNVSTWKLADAIAPLIALGLAVGRIGCYLNGCCWGQPCAPECQPVPLAAALGEFPLLPAHAREQVCRPAAGTDRLPQIKGLQTTTGFTLRPPADADPRAVVAAVEPGSAAEAAGLQPGDKVVGVNGGPNRVVVGLSGSPEAVKAATETLTRAGGVAVGQDKFAGGFEAARVGFDDPAAARAAVVTLTPRAKGGPAVSVTDTLGELARDWPRGVNTLSLVVDRGGEQIPLAFVPRTVPFFPTQLYETVSMLLLIGLLLAFQPFRRHDGQVMVLFMAGYAVHRFFNEAIRIEPVYQLGPVAALTLSQWISVGMLMGAGVLEAYLRLTQPRLPVGPLPLGYGATPAAEGVVNAARSGSDGRT